MISLSYSKNRSSHHLFSVERSRKTLFVTNNEILSINSMDIFACGHRLKPIDANTSAQCSFFTSLFDKLHFIIYFHILRSQKHRRIYGLWFFNNSFNLNHNLLCSHNFQYGKNIRIHWQRWKNCRTKWVNVFQLKFDSFKLLAK